jgi:hypothetical protein
LTPGTEDYDIEAYLGVVAGALLFDELSVGVGVAGVAGLVDESGVVPGVAPGVAAAPLLSVAPVAGAAALPASPAVPLVPEVAGVAGLAVVSVLVVSCLLQPASAAVVRVAASTILASDESVFMADPFDG